MDSEFVLLIKELMAFGITLEVSPEIVGQCKITMIKHNEANNTDYSYSQMLPTNDHIDRRFLDCAHYCVEKLTEQIKEANKKVDA